jgi:hypothetical protein
MELVSINNGGSLDANGEQVATFNRHFLNDQNMARHSMMEQVSGMLMNNIRELITSGAWRHYRNGMGVFEWREHEFDYFLASCLISPTELARLVRNGSIPEWAELVNMTNPGKGKRGGTRRPIDEVADQIRLGVPTGYGDPNKWVQEARTGFGDRNDQMVAADPTRLKKAMRAGNLTAVKKPPQIHVSITHTRDKSMSEDVQRASMIMSWLEKNPGVKSLVKRRLR